VKFNLTYTHAIRYTHTPTEQRTEIRIIYNTEICTPYQRRAPDTTGTHPRTKTHIRNLANDIIRIYRTHTPPNTDH